MTAADLDAAVPGWRDMDLLAFRQALHGLPGRSRPALREAFEALTAPAPVAPLEPTVAPPAPAPAPTPKPPRTGPGVLTPTPPKEG